MEKNQIEQINKMLSELAELGHTQSSICKSTQIGASLMSQLKKGTYKADATKHINILKSFYERIIKTAEAPKLLHKLPFVETANHKVMYSIMYQTAMNSDLAMICGEAGYGKSTTIDMYCKDNPDTILIEADDSFTKKVLVSEICKALGGSGKGNYHDLMQDAVNRLKKTKGINIIIDEANELTWPPINALRRIYDKSKKSFGLILAGHPELRYIVEGSHGTKKQLWSRIDTYLLVSPLLDTDLETIVLKALPDAPKSVINEFKKQCVGNTRVLEKLMKNSISVAHHNDLEVSGGLIKEAVKKLLYKGVG